MIDGKAQPLPLDGSVRQLCIDRQTNEAVAPCETQYIQVEKDSVKQVKGERNTVQQPGHSFKLPFNLEKKSYDWYDLGTRKAVQAKFVGEDKVRDLDVYKFVMEIPPTKVETAREVPGKIVGETDATVKVDRYKAGTRTLWVEPTTGAVVAAEDSGRQELVKSGQQFDSGTVVFEGTLRLNDKTVDKLVADAKDNVSKLWPLTDLPIILWIAGGVLVVGGIVLLLTGGGPSTGRRALGNTQREPVGVG